MAILISFVVCITVPRLSGIRTLAGAIILRLIFSLGIVPTLTILGVLNVSTQKPLHPIVFVSGREGTYGSCSCFHNISLKIKDLMIDYLSILVSKSCDFDDQLHWKQRNLVRYNVPRSD